MAPSFPGFPREAVRFLTALGGHNEKRWFDAHRSDYERHLLDPAKALVLALAPGLARLDPKLHAEPRLNGSILRIHRDTRFSSDKSPYKDHLDLWFWSGREKGWDSSGFFFRLTPHALLLGAGIHGFAPALLARYRRAVVDAKKGSALAALVGKLRKQGYEVGAQRYLRTPKGIAADHPRADLAKHSGLYAAWEGKHPKELTGKGLVTFVSQHYARLAPLHRWLLAM